MSFKLGLTGSIGMGKSTTAEMFRQEGCAVWDADDAVRRLYAKGGAAVQKIRDRFPMAISEDAVSKDALKTLISKDPEALKEIEQIVHPLVRSDREFFAKTAEADILVFDIPLLFETGSEIEFDAIVCVSVSAELQQKRVLARGTMNLEQFEMIRSKQMPPEEKCARSDFVITTETLEGARRQVQDVIKQVNDRISDA